VINKGEPELVRRFTIIQGLLVRHSAFFEAACRNEWKEATTRTIELPDVNIDAFNAYLYRVHKEKIPYDTDCDKGASTSIYDDEAHPTLDALVKLWLLADRLMTAELRNAAADAIICVLKILEPNSDMMDAFPASTIAEIWCATTKDRALRRIVLEFPPSRLTIERSREVFKTFIPSSCKILPWRRWALLRA
jgi:hypothetical protein